jgi:hypothetical protein
MHAAATGIPRGILLDRRRDHYLRAETLAGDFSKRIPLIEAFPKHLPD